MDNQTVIYGLATVFIVLVVIGVVYKTRIQKFTLPASLFDDQPASKLAVLKMEGLNNLPATTKAVVAATPAPAISPADLLPVNPKDKAFAGKKMSNEGILANKNFLQAGSVIGTISEPKRNMNLDFRAEPVIPLRVLSPWNQQTVIDGLNPSAGMAVRGQGLGDVVVV